MTTDANGAATSPAMFKGQYTVREHENPTGYVAELAQQDAAVNPDETTYPVSYTHLEKSRRNL